MAKRPSRPRHIPSVAKLIEDLSCLEEVDALLLGNMSAPDVAKYIQDSQSELKDVKPATLAHALRARRHQLHGTNGWMGADIVVPDESMDDINYRRPPTTFRKVRKGLYDRTEQGIKDMLELEAAYLAQSDRCDRLLELEAITGAFGDITTKALDSAVETLWKRIQARTRLGEGDSQDLDMNFSIQDYSENTVKVLSNPESRRRIMSILERLVNFGKSTEALPLPMPQPQPDGE